MAKARLSPLGRPESKLLKGTLRHLARDKNLPAIRRLEAVRLLMVMEGYDLTRANFPDDIEAAASRAAVSDGMDDIRRLMEKGGA